MFFSFEVFKWRFLTHLPDNIKMSHIPTPLVPPSSHCTAPPQTASSASSASNREDGVRFHVKVGWRTNHVPLSCLHQEELHGLDINGEGEVCARATCCGDAHNIRVLCALEIGWALCLREHHIDKDYGCQQTGTPIETVRIVCEGGRMTRRR